MVESAAPILPAGIEPERDAWSVAEGLRCWAKTARNSGKELPS